MSNVRVGLAMLFTFMLLIAYETVHRQIDYATAMEVSGDSQSDWKYAPVLSILEAYDMPGSRVTVQGTVVTEPTKRSDGSIMFSIKDDTGTLRVRLSPSQGAPIRKGDVLQATGNIRGYQEDAVMTATYSDIELVR
jgi:hypothetical protein